MNKQELINEIVKMNEGESIEVNITRDKELQDIIYCTSITKTRWFDSHSIIIGGCEDELLTSKYIDIDKDIFNVVEELINRFEQGFNGENLYYDIKYKSKVQIKSNCRSLGNAQVNNFIYTDEKIMNMDDKINIKCYSINRFFDDCETEEDEKQIELLLNNIETISKDNDNILFNKNHDTIYVRNNYQVNVEISDATKELIKDVKPYSLNEVLEWHHSEDDRIELSNNVTILAMDCIDLALEKIIKEDTLTMNLIDDYFKYNKPDLANTLINSQVKEALLKEIQKLQSYLTKDIDINWR